ncbi:HIT family protein [Kitasatospora sp. NPDC002965]|uniref:HIT family protein n=1 Tax=Kitasatospora sp. NPDC002965 TaxID=3154775 RepID=UPI0033A73F4A
MDPAPDHLRRRPPGRREGAPPAPGPRPARLTVTEPLSGPCPGAGKDCRHCRSGAPDGPAISGTARCIFCAIVSGTAAARIVCRWPDALALHPLGPVTPGHLLVIPLLHVPDVTTDPEVSAAVMRRVAEIATPPCNIITSAGAIATQSVFHAHIHILPRSAGDGLLLPWSTAAATGGGRRPTGGGASQPDGGSTSMSGAVVAAQRP